MSKPKWIEAVRERLERDVEDDGDNEDRRTIAQLLAAYDEIWDAFSDSVDCIRTTMPDCYACKRDIGGDDACPAMQRFTTLLSRQEPPEVE